MKVGNLFSLKLIAQKETANLTKANIKVTNLLNPEEAPLLMRLVNEKNWDDD